MTTTSTPPACHESWQCGLWSDCSAAGTQTRTCSDIFSCGTTIYKPYEQQACTYTPLALSLTPTPTPETTPTQPTAPAITGMMTAGEAATYAGIIAVIIIIAGAVYWTFFRKGKRPK